MDFSTFSELISYDLQVLSDFLMANVSPFLCYLLIINALSFLLMHIDKQKAVKHQWRISENTLMFSALLGGSIGAIGGMYRFRHKTRKPKFYIGLPVILFLQILLAAAVIVKRF